METKKRLTALRDDPRRCLKAIRSAETPVTMSCDRCGRFVACNPQTAQLARRTDDETLLFFYRCPECGHKLYWKEIHCFTHKIV